MRVVYVRSALPDLSWFRAYYEAIFPEGARNALLQRRAIERLLRENPFVGRVVQEDTNTRVFPISRTPFIVVYRVMGDRIEVLRLWDGRRDPTNFQL
jgi:plasmid stabilization system protein ParE